MSDIEGYFAALHAMPLHSERVREDSTVEDTDIETHYRMCKWVQSAGPKDQRYLRVTSDDNSTDLETRVLYASLIAMGWTPPAETYPIEREKAVEQPHG